MHSYPQGRRTRTFAILLCFTMLLLLCKSGCKPTSTGFGPNSESALPLTVNVTEPVRTEQAIKTASYFGRLVPNRKRTLGFTVGGRLQSLPKLRQSVLKQGVIAELENGELNDQRDELQAEIDRLKAEVGETANTKPLEDRLVALDEQIQARKLLAPFDCLIESTYSSENSLVRAGAPIVSVIEAAKPKLQIKLPRRIADFIYPDDQYVFLMGETLINGSLSEKALTENPPGSLDVWFEIQTDMSDIDFAFGQSVEGRFSFETEDAGYWLPLTALRTSSAGLWSVFVVDNDGEQNTVRQKLVEIKQLRDDAALVIDDLEQQLIIVDGLHRVVAGQVVEIEVVSGTDLETGDGTQP